MSDPTTTFGTAFPSVSPVVTSPPTATPSSDPPPTDPPAAQPPVEPASVVLVGGTVLTMDSARPVARAVGVRDTTIVAVGGEEDLAPYIGPATRVIDLGGRALMPGFVDAHAHFLANSGAIGLDSVSIQDYMLSIGVTSAAEMGVNADLHATLVQLDADGLIRPRMSLYLMHNDGCGEPLGDWALGVAPTRKWGERLRVGGIKIFTDGGSCNAPAVSYELAFGGNGDLYFQAEELAEVVDGYDAAGYQVAVHALGDRAIGMVLDALDPVIGDGENPRRHRIEHNAVLPPEMRGRYDDVGAVPTIFGAFSTCFMLGLDDRFRFSTPVEVQEWEWPWRDLLDMNPETTFAWHGDFPVFADSSPLGSLSGFVTRRQVLDDGTECDPEPYHLKHALTVGEALQLMTMGSAYALDRDEEVGSLEPGKLADMIVLSADPNVVPAEELLDLTVELTMLDGEFVFCGGSFGELCGEPPPGGAVTASAALGTNPPEFAVDGNPDTHWGAGEGPPQWIEIDLGGEQQVAGVRLVVDQAPAGFTRHLVFGRRADGELVRLAEFAGETSAFEVLEVMADEPWAVVAIRVETVESPSWVSWFEIEVIAAS